MKIWEFFRKLYHGTIGISMLALTLDEFIEGYLYCRKGMSSPFYWTGTDFKQARYFFMFQAWVLRANWHLKRSFGHGSAC